MDSLRQDLRFALRQLRRNPGFTSVAVLTLALGIGANTALYSVVRGVLLRPLPYEQPDRLVRMTGYDARTGPDERSAIALANFMDWRETADSFETMAAYNEWAVTLTDGERAARLEGAEVTWELFRVLGVRPAIGRFFLPDEEDGGGARPVVLGHQLWAGRFGADPSIVGRTLVLNDELYTVIGVTGSHFEDPGLSKFDRPVLWRVSPRAFDRSGLDRRSRQFTALARLRAGVTVQQAQSEMDAIMDRLAAEYPAAVANRRVRLTLLHEEMTSAVRTTLLVLFIAVGFVLLIACANVANLLLARGVERARELAVRASLGAGRGRLVRQLLMESVALGLVGGAAGLLLAFYGTDAILGVGGRDLPRADGISVDVYVLFFALAASILAGVLAGLAPVLHLAGTELRAALGNGQSGGVDLDRSRLRAGLVAAQVALATTLLLAAGLLVRSLAALHSVDPGFTSANVLAVQLAPAAGRYPEHPEIDGLHAALHERMRGLPGVESVASVSILPMGDNYIGFGFTIDDRPPPRPGEGLSASIRSATPGYFGLLGIPLLAGRAFFESDRRDAPPVMVITESMARRHWPGERVVGKRVTMRGQSWEIVGVAGDVRHAVLREVPEPAMYVPFAQSPSAWMNRNAALLLRTRTAPAGLASSVREAVRSLDPDIPVIDLRPMSDVVWATTLSERFRTLLLTLFAAVAVALSTVGVYGVVAYTVSRRRREIGVRMALGARGGQVVRLVLWKGSLPAALGLILGTAGALAGSRVMRGLLFEVTPQDPPTFVAALAVLVAAVLLACIIPAGRAARVEPVEALRNE